ncbi:uncharacterized protein CPUR_07599 [Claviceps purpurea 20.1]|uniref:Uncharacterized protein n=1 Tax=Claviceps purpurea (strain 20.1) TaxID=1111077 RepID=M1WFH9_CLAP2|nr:hypothetical protein E4U37_006347 [Claviceps purpurea]CCE33673.1 uncharacterized protein CPUR_07599 [Claviceps purpurea 20.1]
MKFTLSTMMCFLALGASVSARAISEPITHRFVPTWEVTIEPGQNLWEETILVNGTIQQVDAYMEAHYPGWSAKHAHFASPYPVHAKEAPASLPELKKVKSVTCNSPLHQASTRAILGAMDHLRRIGMDRGPRWSPRPGTCSKLSCSDEGAIFWCNDASESALVFPEPTTGLFVLSWDVAIEPGQEDKIVVNGTIQQVDAYMEAHYPGWSAKLANFTYSHSAPAK